MRRSRRCSGRPSSRTRSSSRRRKPRRTCASGSRHVSGDENIEADRADRQRRIVQRRVDGSRQRHRADAAHFADRRARRTAAFRRSRPTRSSEYERDLAHAKEHPADTPEDRYLTERCIGFGGGHAPMLPEPYNNNYYIVQTPDYVTIMAELNHEVRIIPIDGRRTSRARDAVGRRFARQAGRATHSSSRPRTRSRHRHYYGVQMLDSVMSDKFRVVEQFTRTAPDQIRYRATVYDPVFTAPWTVEIFMHPQNGRARRVRVPRGQLRYEGITVGDARGGASGQRRARR